MKYSFNPGYVAATGFLSPVQPGWFGKLFFFPSLVVTMLYT
jgi:hypothetical protein